jgi:signal transduction histidine kinase
MLDADDDKAGTGELGLAIARQNIQMLGGTISAANRDVGLELRICLPRNSLRENH